MATETSNPNDQKAAEGEAGSSEPAFWCNFCDFRTDSSQEYLSHSCQDVLAKRGITVEPTGQNECR